MRRYLGQPIQHWDGSEEDDLREGYYYLICSERDGAAGRYYLRTSPGRTNMSGESRTRGWLGTTDNVAQFARGCVQVRRDASGRVRIRPVAERVLAAREETAEADAP
jgi:hypothetical protein